MTMDNSRLESLGDSPRTEKIPPPMRNLNTSALARKEVDQQFWVDGDSMRVPDVLAEVDNLDRLNVTP
jgi:hypothetical protein